MRPYLMRSAFVDSDAVDLGLPGHSEQDARQSPCHWKLDSECCARIETIIYGDDRRIKAPVTNVAVTVCRLVRQALTHCAIGHVYLGMMSRNRNAPTVPLESCRVRPNVRTWLSRVRSYFGTCSHASHLLPGSRLATSNELPILEFELLELELLAHLAPSAGTEPQEIMGISIARSGAV